MTPKAGFANHHQVGLPQKGQVTRDTRLGSTEALHDVADAEFSASQNVKNPQSCPVGERPEHQVNRILCLGLHGLCHTKNRGTATGAV